MRTEVTRKWRPTIGLVIFSVLLAVLALPTAIIVWFRWFEGTSDSMGTEEVGALTVALLLTLVVALVLTRTIAGPINALVRRAEEIAHGGRAAIQPLDRYGTREIATLSQSLLDLASRLVEHTEDVRSFAAHVSHELKSPLTSIKGAAELLRDESGEPMTAEERRRFLDHIVADADRLTKLLARLRELAQADLPAGPGETRLAAIADELAARFPNLEIVTRGQVDQAIALSDDAALAILGHLAENAQQHGARRFEIDVHTVAGAISLRVSDDGTGIAPGNRALVMQPFFSTRRDSGGTGMGLSIVQAMLGAHGGSISLVESDAGTAFEIRLPPR